MAIDNFDTGIRSVTYVTDDTGKPIEIDAVGWTIADYHVNQQATPTEDSIEPLSEVSVEKKPRKPRRKGVASENPKQVGQELVEKAHQKDLKKRGLK